MATDENRPPAGDVPSYERTDVIAKPRVLSGKYKLGRLLGEGGMGAVYEADHAGLDAKVAVKLLSEGGALDHKALARFRREARAMGAIRHENVVAVLDTGADDEGVPYLVMELLEGESLASMLRRERQIAPALAIWITCQVLSGLSAAHAKGVVHRDLKPGNVFIARQADGSHKVKILDFGISKLSEVSSESMNVTAAGALVGTPNFMAPEQITGSVPIDGRVDIYAVGILLYRMVTGRLPFVGKTSEELYRKILAGTPVPPRKRQPDLPVALEDAIVKALSQDREHRFPDCGGFREILLEIARTLPGELPALPTAMPTTGGGARPMAISAAELSNAATASGASNAARRSASRPSGSAGVGVAAPSSSAAALASVPLASGSLALEPGKQPWRWAVLFVLVLALGGATVAGVLLAQRHDPRGAVASVGGPPAFDGPPLRYGVQRYSAREAVVAAHQPLADYLARALARPVELVVEEDDAALRDSLINGRLELAALSSYAYVRARKVSRDLALIAKPVSATGSSYQGLILTRAESPAQQLTDLRGQKFCFVQPGSTSGYLYPRALLREAGVDPDRELIAVFGQDHLTTLRLLDRGTCAAASVYALILDAGEQNGIPASRFRALASTDRIPYDAYTVRRTQPQPERDALQAALLALEPGSAAAHAVFGDHPAGEIVGFVRAADADYEGVRRIEHLLDDAQPRR